jgi:demethylmenaquinone methyltransferase/2-methoxy-6-polyprenyl-1,4-benzoquinol methylase
VDDELLADQRTFYRRRVPEYDDWWQRRGAYDRGPEHTAQWSAEVAEVEQALAAFGAAGNVLELAGGTGWWTARLATTADRLTVVDGAPEALEVNRARVDRADVEYVIADLFAWAPPAAHAYDVVFFSFWLSHVPRARFESFWSLVGSCLAPDGRVFLVDNRRDPSMPSQDPFVLDHGHDDVQRRRLRDGSEHRVVKVFHEPDELATRLRSLGWHADIRATATAFVYGTASVARTSPTGALSDESPA